jgi:hypothetical protein
MLRLSAWPGFPEAAFDLETTVGARQNQQKTRASARVYPSKEQARITRSG